MTSKRPFAIVATALLIAACTLGAPALHAQDKKDEAAKAVAQSPSETTQKQALVRDPLAAQPGDHQALQDIAEALGDDMIGRPDVEQLQIMRLGAAILNERNAE